MKLFALLSTLLASTLLPRASATALTTAVGANQRLCFHADADKEGEKIGVSDRLQPGLAISYLTRMLTSSHL